MKKIIFLCTGNTCRSPMAEFLAKDIFKNNSLNYNVESRGLSIFLEMPLAQNAVKALKNYNIEIENHKSKMITNNDIEECDYVFTMTSNHKDILLDIYNDNYKDKIYMLSEFTINKKKDIMDPFGGDLETYKKSADEIKDYINKLVIILKENDMEE